MEECLREKVYQSTSSPEILNLFKSYVEKNMLVEPETAYLDKALEVSLDHSITVYDALYIAQALKHGKPLLTLDQKQREIVTRLGIRVYP